MFIHVTNGDGAYQLKRVCNKLRTYCRSQKHPFHILDASPYPFLVSFFLVALLIPVTFYMHGIELAGIVGRSDLIHAAFIGLYLVAMS